MKSAFDIALEIYKSHINQDYIAWGDRCARADDSEVANQVRSKMREEFKDGIRHEVGNKYIRVICGTSCHSFIVKKDFGKWKAGDVLKAASWAGPATNFSRGNILESDLKNITWTGAN